MNEQEYDIEVFTIFEKELKEVLEQFDANKNIGRIRIETVEDMQNQIVAMINLQALVSL